MLIPDWRSENRLPKARNILIMSDTGVFRGEKKEEIFVVDVKSKIMWFCV